jgi:hypothetical protein
MSDADDIKRVIREHRLEISRLKMRSVILQQIVLRHDVAIPVLHGEQTHAASIQRTQDGLEVIGASLEKIFLTDPAFAHFDDAHRAQYADEIREMVESMKAYVRTLEDE